jgi:hypothetical protein
MAEVSMGDVESISDDNEGLPLEGAVDDSSVPDFSAFEGLSAELAQESGYADEVEEEASVERGIDSSSFEEGDPEPEQAPVEETPRAQKRIQRLSGDVKGLKEQLAQQQAYYQQQMGQLMHQQQQGQQASRDAQRQQLEHQQRQLELLQGQRQKEDYAKLSPMDQLKADILREAGQSSSQQVNGQLAQLREELDQERQARSKQLEESQRQARYDFYTKQTQEAVSNVLFENVAPEDRKALADEAEEMTLAYAGAYEIQPEEAARRLKTYIQRTALAMIKNQTSKKGKQVRKSRAVPKTAPGGRRSTQASKMAMPSLAQLRKAGYDSHIDWIAANEPPVS